MAQQKMKHAAHTQSCQNARANQGSRRERRINRHLNQLLRKASRMETQGRSTEKINKAIEQAEYALSYTRTEGKKGQAGMPEHLKIPHDNSSE